MSQVAETLGNCTMKFAKMRVASSSVVVFTDPVDSINMYDGVVNQFEGAVLAGDVLVASSIGSENPFVLFDLKTGTFNETTIAGDGGYEMCVLGPDELVYCAPDQAQDHIPVIDPISRTVDTTTYSGLPYVTPVCSGLVSVPDEGLIVCVPAGATYIPIVDTVEKTVDFTSLTGFSGHFKYSGGALGSDGLVYCTPDRADHVLIIDPVAKTADSTTLSGLGTDSNKFGVPTAALGGSVIVAPAYYRDAFIFIDVATQTMDVTTASGYPTTFKWPGCVTGPGDDMVYCVPNPAELAIVDPATKAVDLVDVGVSANNQYRTCTISDAGLMYCPPFYHDQLLVVDVNRL